MRKMHLAMRANALVVFPGGFGTMDELFEILTLRQTGKAPEIPIILMDEDYWRSVINFQTLLEHGMIARRDLDSVCLCGRCAERPGANSSRADCALRLRRAVRCEQTNRWLKG